MSKKPDLVIKQKDPVSESVKKEQISSKINQEFHLNQPQKLQFNTEKPNNNPYLLMKLRNQGRTIRGVDYNEKLEDGLNRTELSQVVNEKLKTVTHTPKDKWDVPQTSNQQIGWFADKKQQQNQQFIHKRAGCNETHYADSYYTMKHCSLFSNKSQK